MKKILKEYYWRSGSAPYAFTYTDIPDAPSDGTSATITFSSPGNILNNSGGTTQNKYLSGEWEEFHAFSFVATHHALGRGYRTP